LRVFFARLPGLALHFTPALLRVGSARGVLLVRVRDEQEAQARRVVVARTHSPLSVRTRVGDAII
jgi:hypothetical protein